jgi:hypothetical protein
MLTHLKEKLYYHKEDLIITILKMRMILEIIESYAAQIANMFLI